MNHLLGEEALRYDNRVYGDAYVLPNAKIVMHPYSRYGTALEPAALSSYGLAAMADILGLEG
ncbi:hypothetical protein [Actinokineospora diospyrosa]|uniref:Uncharacterized protein n=1 Tax=Actinokineospora diospyrosa TaxID=103728 RepID=A0ABT1IC90_9PSEU|nr:hypothetical protein [Actinokineospora diospyrosa]MCP2270260.1 hypothetical protein [Actinokineospora diospyrosa]